MHHQHLVSCRSLGLQSQGQSSVVCAPSHAATDSAQDKRNNPPKALQSLRFLSFIFVFYYRKMSYCPRRYFHAVCFPIKIKATSTLCLQANYFTCKIPTRNVRVLAISTLCASLDSVSISVPVPLVPVALLPSMRKLSSGAMLNTTDPTIKLTTGNGPVMTNRNTKV